MKVLIRPKKLNGVLNIVPSKSYSHRAIIAASLSEGESVIKNLLFSDDVERTIEACRGFGAQIKAYSDYIVVNGVDRPKRVFEEINCGESGSTIRFMIPIMMVNPQKMRFLGENNLVNRPLDLYTEIFDKQNIKYEQPIGKALPLICEGALKPDLFHLRGDVSSQFITGLLFALPLLDKESQIIMTTPLESQAYVDLTIDILSLFGIKIINENYQKFIIPGNQKYKANDYTVEGDYSQAAFFLVAGALGNNVRLRMMNENSYQGDKKVLDDLKLFGAQINKIDDGIYANAKALHNAVIDFAQTPDLGPALTVLASLAEGETKFINASRLRIKECDRITCMRLEMEKLGAKITETQDSMTINGIKELGSSLELYSHNDHRIAMSLAIASTRCCGPIMIEKAECVKKSYPHFWDDFRTLGGDFDVID